MQLLLILAVLLLGGKTDARELLSEVKPVLENLGGEEIKEALKSAEELSGVLSAVQSFASAAPQDDSHSDKPAGISFPLAPISDIADRDITYSLSQYISHS